MLNSSGNEGGMSGGDRLGMTLDKVKRFTKTRDSWRYLLREVKDLKVVRVTGKGRKVVNMDLIRVKRDSGLIVGSHNLKSSPFIRGTRKGDYIFSDRNRKRVCLWTTTGWFTHSDGSRRMGFNHSTAGKFVGHYSYPTGRKDIVTALISDFSYYLEKVKAEGYKSWEHLYIPGLDCAFNSFRWWLLIHERKIVRNVALLRKYFVHLVHIVMPKCAINLLRTRMRGKGLSLLNSPSMLLLGMTMISTPKHKGPYSGTDVPHAVAYRMTEEYERECSNKFVYLNNKMV